MALSQAPELHNIVRFIPPGSHAPATSEVFAAVGLELRYKPDRDYLADTHAASLVNSREPWKWYEKIGEVSYAIARSARIAGYAKLQVRKRNPDGTAGDLVDDERAQAALGRIYSPYGGLRGLIERYYTLRKVPADMHLIRCRNNAGQPDGYMVLSCDEMDLTQLDKGIIKWWTTPKPSSSSRGRPHHVVQIDDYLGRLWTPSSRWIDLPDSRLNTLDTECFLLYELTESLKSKVLSRFAMSGLMFLPSEINDVRVSNARGESRQDRFMDVLAEAMARNVAARDDASARIPIIVRGPGAAGQQIRFITIDSELWETDIKLRAELIDRILQGLDVQHQAVMGVGDTNHWAAWAVSDEERRITVQPDIEAMCWGFERLIFNRELLAAGVPESKVSSWMLWYDLSGAAVKTNQQEDVRQLYDRGEVNGAVLRRVSGALDSEAMDERERIRWVGVKMLDPYLALYGTEEDIDWSKVGAGRRRPGPIGPIADEPNVGPGVGNPGSPDDNETDTPRSERPA